MKILKLNFIIVLSSFCLLVFNNKLVFSQDKYVHLRGGIDSEEPVSADLIFMGKKVFGTMRNHYTREIPVIVHGEFTQEGKLLITEKSEENLMISGILSANLVFNGTWRDDNDELREFEISAYYPEGTHKFEVFSLSSVKPLSDSPDSPVAAFEICILLPTNEMDENIRKNLTKAISDLVKTNFIADPDTELQKQEALFYDQYRLANTDISTPENYPYLNWQKRKLLSLVLNRADLISFYLQDYTYSGGEMSLDISRYLVYDLKTDKKISINDLIIEDKFPELSVLLRKELCNMLGISEEDSLTALGFFSDEVFPSTNFFLTSSGIGFHYNAYELAGQETGPVSIYLTFDEMQDILISNSPAKRLNVAFK